MNNTIFVGLDVHKEKIAVAVAEGGRGGEVRQLGNFLNRPDHIKNWSNGWPRVIVLCHFVTKLVVTKLGHAAMAFIGS